MPGADHATIYNLAEDIVRRTYEKQEVSSKTSKTKKLTTGHYTKIKREHQLLLKPLQMEK